MEHQTAGRQERDANFPASRELPGALAALDWHEITCKSETACRNPATHIVHLHAVDECNQQHLDSSGNFIDILCARCFSATAVDILGKVDWFRRFPRPSCLTCGAPVAELTDIVREVSAV